MNEEINNLKSKIESIKKENTSFLEQTLNAFATVLCAPIVLAVEVVKGIAALFWDSLLWEHETVTLCFVPFSRHTFIFIQQSFKYESVTRLRTSMPGLRSLKQIHVLLDDVCNIIWRRSSELLLAAVTNLKRLKCHRLILAIQAFICAHSWILLSQETQSQWGLFCSNSKLNTEILYQISMSKHHANLPCQHTSV